MCGIFGIIGHREAANLTYLGLYALQHRGQESAGIVSSDSAALHNARDMGQVADVFPEEGLKRLPGDALIAPDKLIAARDPRGFRPLSMGRLEGAICFASETCAFDLIGAEFVRDIEPGELLVADRRGMRSYHPFPPAAVNRCIFEFVYFARPDSRLFGQPVSLVRKRMGAELAVEHPAEADIVVPVPDSGVSAAIGYSEKSGIPYEFGLIRNHYVGRTFIEPQQSIRHFGVKVKLNPVRELIKGKRVVLVDDSIVRGTTSRKIVSMLRDVGAAEVHVRISCPPTIGPCY